MKESGTEFHSVFDILKIISKEQSGWQRGPTTRKVFLGRNYEIDWNQGIGYRNWGSFYCVVYKSRHMKIYENRRCTQKNRPFRHTSFPLLQQAQWSVYFFLFSANLLTTKQAVSLDLTLLQCTEILGSVQRWRSLELITAKVYNCIFSSSFSFPGPACV